MFFLSGQYNKVAQDQDYNLPTQKKKRCLIHSVVRHPTASEEKWAGISKQKWHWKNRVSVLNSMSALAFWLGIWRTSGRLCCFPMRSRLTWWVSCLSEWVGKKTARQTGKLDRKKNENKKSRDVGNFTQTWQLYPPTCNYDEIGRQYNNLMLMKLSVAFNCFEELADYVTSV